MIALQAFGAACLFAGGILLLECATKAVACTFVESVGIKVSHLVVGAVLAGIGVAILCV